MATVTTEQELLDAISNKESQIEVTNDIKIQTLITIDYDLHLYADNAVLSYAQKVGDMIEVINGATLTLDTITFDGNGANTTLIQIIGATVIINDGVIIQNVLTGYTDPKYPIEIYSSDTMEGHLIMNGGTLTGLSGYMAIYCNSSTIAMRNDTSITNSDGGGITVEEGTLTMEGNASITNITGTPLHGINANITMGVSEGDSPKIENNTSELWVNSGVVLQSSTLNMNYEASISNNQSNYNYGCVLVANGSQVNMRGNSKISRNRALQNGSNGGGIEAWSENTVISMYDNATISGNSATNGGGIFLDDGTTLNMGSASTDSPTIEGNTASTGGGIYISEGATVNVSGNSRIDTNIVDTIGCGIYNLGTLNIAEGVQIRDGLYFNSLETTPYIVGPLTINATRADTNATVQLEDSDYLHQDNIPVAVATNSEAYTQLRNTYNAAFTVPTTFSENIATYVSTDQAQVMVGEVIGISSASFRIIRVS